MKKNGIKLLSFLLAFAVVIAICPVISLKASADAVAYSQYSEPWCNWVYGGGNIADTGCGIVSTANALNYLKGGIDVESFIDRLATWAHNRGAFNPGNSDDGTYRTSLYPYLEDEFGDEFGFTVDGSYWTGASSSVLKEHLAGGGVAVGHVYGHFICLAGYDSSDNTFLILDSAPSWSRGTPYGVAWLSEYEIDYGYEKLGLDYFCLISSTGGSAPPAGRTIYNDSPDFRISSCDYMNAWDFHPEDEAGGGITLDGGNKTQGDYSISYTQTGGFHYCYHTPGEYYDFSSVRALTFDFYTDNTDIFTNSEDCGIIISSRDDVSDNDSLYDTDWSAAAVRVSGDTLRGLNLVQGWNSLIIPIDYSDPSEGFEINYVTKIKLFALKYDGTNTEKLDNLCASSYVPYNTTPDFRLSSCDYMNVWGFHPEDSAAGAVTQDSVSKTQGDYSISYTQTGGFHYCYSTPGEFYDFSAVNYIKFDFYTQNTDIFTNCEDAGIIISSNNDYSEVSGLYDSNWTSACVRVNWDSMKNLKLSSGWNHVVLPIDYSTATGDFDRTKVIKLRLFSLKYNGSNTEKLDNLWVSDNDSPLGSTLPGSTEIEPFNDSGDFLISSCDHIDDVWRFHPEDAAAGSCTLDTDNKTQGSASINYTQSGGFHYCYYTPGEVFDCTDVNYITFDFYTENTDIFTNCTDAGVLLSSKVDFTSIDSIYDSDWTNACARVSWDSMKSVTLNSGWNHLVLPVEFSSATEGFDRTRVAKVKIYSLKYGGSNTEKLDNLCAASTNGNADQKTGTAVDGGFILTNCDSNQNWSCYTGDRIYFDNTDKAEGAGSIGLNQIKGFSAQHKFNTALDFSNVSDIQFDFKSSVTDIFTASEISKLVLSSNDDSQEYPENGNSWSTNCCTTSLSSVSLGSGWNRITVKLDYANADAGFDIKSVKKIMICGLTYNNNGDNYNDEHIDNIIALYGEITLPTYACTLNIKKDGTDWNSNSKTYTLKSGENTYSSAGQSGSAKQVFTVPKGNYTVYCNGTATDTIVNVSSSAVTRIFNFYTVNYQVYNRSGAASTISATYDGKAVASGSVVEGGKTLAVTAANGENYTFSWNDSHSTVSSTLKINNLSSKADLICTVSVSVKLGDSDNNMTVDSADALIVLEYSVHKVELTDEIIAVCDVNSDGYLNCGDALLILNYSVGKITAFPAAD